MHAYVRLYVCMHGAHALAQCVHWVGCERWVGGQKGLPRGIASRGVCAKVGRAARVAPTLLGGCQRLNSPELSC